MNEFAGVLREIHQKLDVPQPEKSRIILEIAADLEDMYQHYLSQGLSPNAAKKRTTARLSLSETALHELAEVHQSRFLQFMNRFSIRNRMYWEYLLLMLIFLLSAQLCGLAITSGGFSDNASPFVWPILGDFLGFILISLFKIFKLFLVRDYNPRNIWNGMQALFLLAGANLSIGMLGYIWEVFRAKGDAFHHQLRLLISRQPAEDVIGTTLPQLFEWLMRSSSLMVVLLSTTIISAIVCFTLVTRIQAVEMAESKSLFYENKE